MIADSKNRDQLLYGNVSKNIKKSHGNQNEGTPNFVTSYSREFNKFKNIVVRNLPFLIQDPTLEQILEKGVRCVASKAKSLRNSLSPSTIYTPQKTTWLQYKGCYKCGQNRCGLCKFLKQTDCFTSSSNSKNFRIYSLNNYNTTHMVYLADYTMCNLQYIRCTIRKSKIKLGEHITAIKNTASFTRCLSGLLRSL